MAVTIEQDDQIEINNIDKDQFDAIKISTVPHQKFREEIHWSHYFLCGYKAITTLWKEQAVKNPKGMKILIESLVPPAAGVSSSSAFTVCSALATAHANGLKIQKEVLADLTVQAERLTGMQSGGMDQTISVMGELGKAKLVQFNPIRTTDVQIPEGYVFVVANSLTPSPKLQHKGTKYNKRVVECRFVLYILA